MIKIEEKVLRYFDTEMRADDTGEEMRVSGYALKFDKETQIGNRNYGWIEKISREAMNTSILTDVILCFNHSWDKMLARTTNGSLTLSVDDVGLLFNANIVNTTEGRDIFKLIKNGLINRMSFAVEILKSKWEISEIDNEPDRRTITEFGRFYDVSAVTFPAYEDTNISARGYNVVDEDVKKHFETREKEVRSYESQIKKLNAILNK